MARTKKVTRDETQEELRQLALLADAISGLTHALNNHLNGVVLQAAALQLRVPEEFREGLERIRREGTQAAHLFRPLQLVRQQARQSFQQVNLTALVQELLTERGVDDWKIGVSAEVVVPAALGAARRMFQYLFESMAEYRDPHEAGVISFHTGDAAAVELELKLADPGMQDALGRLGASQEQDLSLHFLAIRSLIRLLEGRLDVEALEPDRVRIRLAW